MRKIIPTIVIILLVIAAGYYLYAQKGERAEIAAIDSFAKCAAAGYPVMESFPEQCRTPDGRTFVNDGVGGAAELKQYSNVAYGISFTYPGGHILTEAERGNGERGHYSIVLVKKEDVVTPENGEGPTAVTVDIYQNTIDKLSLLNWLKNTNASNFKLSDNTFASTTVAGAPAVTYRWSGLYEGETTAFLHEGNIIAVTVTYMNSEDRNIQAYGQILSSLKLSAKTITAAEPELM
jgi:hypothetical protein